MDDENVDFRRWDQLVPDLLGLAFCKLSLEEKVLAVPVVYKAWWRVVMGSSSTCWKEIVIDTRSNKRVLVRLLRMLILRSGRSMHKLSVPDLPNKMFSLVAEYGGRLETLELRWGKMTDSTIEKLCEVFLAQVFGFELLYSNWYSNCCTRIAPALFSIGRHCKLLESFYRNAGLKYYGGGRGSEDDEAYAIAAAMPKLKHLEVSSRLMTTRGVLAVLNCCAELKSINIRRCWGVELDKHFLSERFPELKVIKGFSDAYSSDKVFFDGITAYTMSARFGFDDLISLGYDSDEHLDY